MPTVVDELVVKIGLDSSQFKKGREDTSAELKKVRDEATTTGKTMQADGAKAAEFFAAIKIQALSLIGILTGSGALGAIIKNTSDSLAAFGRTVGMIGGDPQQIQAFELAIGRMGGTVDAAHASLLGLSKARQDFITLGQGAQSFGFMSAIGAQITDSPLTIMARFADYIKKTLPLPGGEARIRQMGEGSGIDFSTIAAMIQMAKVSDLATEMRKSFELGAVASKQQIEAAQKFQTSVTSFEQAVQGLAKALIPFEALATMMDEIVTLIKPETRENVKKALDKQEQFQREHQQAPQSGPNSWFNKWWNSPSSGSSGFWEWLLGKDMLQDRERNASGGGVGSRFIGPGTGSSGGGGSGGGEISPPLLPTQARANMERTREFWKSKGFTDAQTAGILAGGPAGESGFDPNAVGGGGDTGLYQWTGSRKAALVAKYGPHPTLDQQNEFAWEEMQTNYKRVLDVIRANPNDPEAVARIMADVFENPYSNDPARHAAEVAKRARAARKFLPPPTPDPALAPGRLPGPRVPDQKVSSNDNSQSIQIDQISVHTQATDAKGIASSMRNAMSNAIVAQSNRGLV